MHCLFRGGNIFFIAIGGWIPMGNVALQLEMQS